MKWTDRLLNIMTENIVNGSKPVKPKLRRPPFAVAADDINSAVVHNQLLRGRDVHNAMLRRRDGITK